ncbi:hypothetical protein [Burkholderia cenocepacia]|uniref:hypothetical protein n=1 Tax=Burkholderia cenocepacia TaxID=95486 RepID=UPI002AAFD3B0|nr:hypothetical protein [Burkholderia cenocepacia]
MLTKKIVVCGCIAMAGALAGCGGDGSGPTKTLRKIVDVVSKKPVQKLPNPSIPTKPTPPNNPGKPPAGPLHDAVYDLYGMGTPYGSSTALADARFENYGGFVEFEGAAPSAGTFSITATDGYGVSSSTQDPRIQSATPGVVMSAEAGGRLVGVCSPDNQGLENTLPAYVGILTLNDEWDASLKPANTVDANTALQIIDKHANEGAEVVGCASANALAWSRPGTPGTVVGPGDSDPKNWPVRVHLSSTQGAADTQVNYEFGPGTVDFDGTPWLTGENLRKALSGTPVKTTTGAAVTATAYILDSSLYVFLTRGKDGDQPATTYVLRYPASLS